MGTNHPDGIKQLVELMDKLYELVLDLEARITELESQLETSFQRLEHLESKKSS